MLKTDNEKPDDQTKDYLYLLPYKLPAGKKMDRVSEEIGMIPFQQYGTDFGLIDFMDEANFDQYIDLIRGENEQTEAIFNSNIYQGYDYHDGNNNMGVVCSFDGHFFPAAPPPTVGLFDFDDATGSNPNPDLGFVNNAILCQDQADHDEEIIMGDEDESSGSGSGGATTNNETSKKGHGKTDRSRTLISERKRRSRMKEKLYALRSLVPNITKMDKASIVGDAVLYVQDLKMQAKKLKAEIANLESSLNNGGDNYQEKNTKTNPISFCSVTKKIFKMDVSKVEERGFYVRIVSNKGKGVAMLLYRALESLTTFTIHNSNLAASPHNYVFTFTLHTMQGEIDVSLENMKLWMVSVFLNQGFEFQTSQSA